MVINHFNIRLVYTHGFAEPVPIPCVPWIQTERGDVKGGVLKLALKANKCSDAGTGDLGMLPTHEILPCN